MTTRNHPTYNSCVDWRSIVVEHQKTIRIPAELISCDPNLTEWRNRVNLTFEPPSDDRPGPTFESLIKHPATASILDKPKQALCHPHILNGKDATGLVELMKTGQVSVEQMTNIFLARTAIVHQATGCLSHYFGDIALERARTLDQKRCQLEKQGKLDQLGNLFGLPMSIKGHIHYAGQGSQRGFVFDVLPSPATHPLVRANLKQEQVDYLVETQGGYVNQPIADAHVASLLIAADAVILGKTTMPQGIMHLDDRSNLYGQTLNPWNLALSPGGSSGGESALVAAGGTALGLGSDIGGSIRQPSGVCNLYGLRPTTLRMPYNGIRSTMPGNEGVGSSIGPMALSLRDVELFMTSVVNEKTRPWEREHALLPLPWRKVDSLFKAQGKKITIGVMLQDGVVTPVAPVRRAMTAWLDKLKAWAQTPKGQVRVELKLWEPKDLHKRAWDLIRSLYFMDSGKIFHLLAKATGEPLLPLTEFILDEPFVRSGAKDLAAVDSGDEVRKLDEMSATDVWRQSKRREAFRKEFLQQWNELELDCLFCPVMGNVAPRPGKIKYWGYTSVFNLVDHPGVVFPSGLFADAKVDQSFEEQEASKLSDEDALAYKEVKTDLGQLDVENRFEYEEHRAVFDGAPIGLQMIGRRFQDEELCKYAELLEQVCR